MQKSDRFPKWECALKSEITILEIPNRGMTVINESGLYSLILSSKLPSAKEFKHWVTSEVLPSIRKNGAYIRNQENMTPAEIVARGLIAAQKIIEERLDHSTQPLFILTYSH